MFHISNNIGPQATYFIMKRNLIYGRMKDWFVAANFEMRFTNYILTVCMQLFRSTGLLSNLRISHVQMINIKEVMYQQIFDAGK